MTATAPVRRHRRQTRVLVPLALVLAGLLAAWLAIGRDENAAAPATAERPELQRLLSSAVTGPDRIAPGVTAYLRGPRGTWLGAAGVANCATHEPMKPDARMRLESVSKIWTATLILQLAQERSLQLTDSVDRWLPGVLPYGRRITIGQLLTHTSGMIDNNDVVRAPHRYLRRVRDAGERARLRRLGERWGAHPELEFSPTAWIRLAAWQPLLFRPGTDYHYSNIGFEILGLVAARVTGRSVAGLYAERFFRPLGLRSAAYDPQGPIAGPHPHAYSISPSGRMTDVTDWHGGIGAEGAVVSDARDTAALLTALMGGRLLGPAQLGAMRSGAFWSFGVDLGCGVAAYGHSGAGSGFKADVWVSADGSRVVVLMFNGRTGDRGDARAAQIVNRLYCEG
jgi:D-alanyl-D-alanine carboxypeptidase